MDQDIAACAGLVERGDPDRFLAIMSTPVAVREKLFPLFAFNAEVARAPWVTQETMIAEMRLQWWRDALDEIAGKGFVRRHEVVTPLSVLLAPEQVVLLDQLIAARRWDVYKDPFEDMDHFREYLNHTSGNLMLVATQLVGQADEAAVRKVAYADGLARWFMAIPKLQDAGRIPMVDGRSEAVQALASEALSGLADARKSLKGVSAEVAGVLRQSWRAQAILKQVSHSPELVADAALGDSEFSRKFSLLWRSVRATW